VVSHLCRLIQIITDTQIFGVDLLLSLPEQSSAGSELSIPRVTLLEYNASPDFHQSGTRLRRDLSEVFRGVVELSVKPFFNLGQDGDEKTTDVGEEKYGWRMVGKGEVRGPSK
jgi:tubulin--tyrosine ligase